MLLFARMTATHLISTQLQLGASQTGNPANRFNDFSDRSYPHPVNKLSLMLPRSLTENPNGVSHTSPGSDRAGALGARAYPG